jgi:hypothetical protein
MASINQLCEVIARTTGEDIMRVRAVARTLINNDMLPKASGRSIPTARPHHAAFLLLGIYVANVPASAAPPVLAYSKLMEQGSKASRATARELLAIEEGDCLSALAGAIAVGDTRLDYIEICLSWPEVLFKFKKGRENRFLQPWVDPNYRQIDRPKKLVIIPGKIAKVFHEELFFDWTENRGSLDEPSE